MARKAKIEKWKREKIKPKYKKVPIMPALTAEIFPTKKI